KIPAEESGGLTAQAVDPDLLDTLQGDLDQGHFIDGANGKYPVVVLGSVAAERLGIHDITHQAQVRIGDEWFTVLGILKPLDLAPETDRSALTGHPIATDLFDAPETPGTLYLRAEPDQVDNVASVVPATANPESPDKVNVSRPSDAIEARAAAKSSFTSL